MNLDKELVKKIYHCAFYIRKVEEKIAENYYKGFIRCPTHLSIGQELVPAVLSLFENSSDLAVSTHRSHGHYLGKGGSLKSFFDELHGLPSGCSSGHGGSMHLTDINVGFVGSTAIVANTIPVGVGLANSLSLESSENFVYIFLGDGATEEGVFYESLHYASLNNLPCLFIVENNEYSVYTPIKTRQGCISIKDKINGFNVKYLLNNNHDYTSLYHSFASSIADLRSGQGPIAIEVKTHRVREHCGPNLDDDLAYRDDHFIETWNDLDIIKVLENDLLDMDYSIDDMNQYNDSICNHVDSTYLESQEMAQSLRI